MLPSALLLTAALHWLPPPVCDRARPSKPWVNSLLLAATARAQYGLSVEWIMGVHQEQPLPLAVVSLPGAPQARVELTAALAFVEMATAARLSGITLVPTSGFRTFEAQAALYRDYQRGRGPLAAKPGFSNHQSGHAIDIDTRSPLIRRWLWQHSARFGFVRTVPSERWHFEFWAPDESRPTRALPAPSIPLRSRPNS